MKLQSLDLKGSFSNIFKINHLSGSLSGFVVIFNNKNDGHKIDHYLLASTFVSCVSSSFRRKHEEDGDDDDENRCLCELRTYWSWS